MPAGAPLYPVAMMLRVAHDHCADLRAQTRRLRSDNTDA
jgi:hypothetical protein